MQTQVKVGSDTILKLEREKKEQDRLLDTARKDLTTCRLQQQKVSRIIICSTVKEAHAGLAS
jgi:hypothetical protein